MNKKHTIVHVITSLKMGGAESLLVEYLSSDYAQEYTHKVVYFHDGPNRVRLQEKGIAYYQIKGLVSIYDPVFFMRLYKVVKSLQPDCIHSWLWSANMASRLVSKLLQVPLLNSFHSNVDQDGAVRNSIDSYTQHIPNSLIAVSYGVAQSITDRTSMPNPDRLKVVKNGVDVRKIVNRVQNSPITRQQLGLLDTQYVIGSVGRWVACKNYSFLIDLFARVYKNHNVARLLLLGKGEQKELLTKQVYSLGLQDAVLFIENKVALDYYALMDCFVQTSFKEGISIALLEAMSCSLPCLIVQSVTPHEVIKNGYNGTLVPTHSLPLAYDALERLIIDHTYATMVGENGYKTIQNEFDLEVMINNYYKEYDQLISMRAMQ